MPVVCGGKPIGAREDRRELGRAVDQNWKVLGTDCVLLTAKAEGDDGYLVFRLPAYDAGGCGVRHDGPGRSM